jgi:hypothetical protein
LPIKASLSALAGEIGAAESRQPTFGKVGSAPRVGLAGAALPQAAMNKLSASKIQRASIFEASLRFS